jgi:maleylacetoacetate isomerase/maleylpyruvate isomerase
MITLYDYVRSSASCRVRLALAFKQIPYETIPVHLVNNQGEQHAPEYRTKNPQGLVPTLATEFGILTQSLAILEWLEETYPTPALLPQDPIARARARSFSLQIACDIHPLNNLRVLHYLEKNFHITPEQKTQWYHHWLALGFEALEVSILGPFCMGQEITLADLCLLPQIYNAKRFALNLNPYPKIQALDRQAQSLPWVEAAMPPA